MTDEEINIAIAEARGLFRIEPLRRTTRKGKPDPNGVVLWYCSEHHGGAATYVRVPNYCNDLNACRGIIEWLNSSENDRRGAAVAFCEALKEIHEEDNSCWIECAVPSAKQVCRAFLRAFNRWQR